MTSRPPAQCAYCKHYRSPLDTGLDAQTCTAYPLSIPADIWTNQADHRQPQPGDNGIRWEPAGADVTYPEKLET